MNMYIYIYIFNAAISRSKDDVKVVATAATALLDNFRTADTGQLIKELAIQFEYYATATPLAHRAIGGGPAFCHPNDVERRAAKAAPQPCTMAGAGGPNGNGPLQVLTPDERVQRTRLYVSQNPEVMGMSVTPYGCEVHRQLMMRSGVELGPVLLATLKMNADGASGFGLNASPYELVLHDDVFVSGLAGSSCVQAFPSAAVGTFGPGADRIDRSTDLLFGGELGSAIVYCREHVDAGELPLPAKDVLENQGMVEPYVGVDGQASVLGSGILGSVEPQLDILVRKDATRIGIPDFRRQIQAYYSSCLFAHHLVPLLFPAVDHNLQRGTIPYLDKVTIEQFNALNNSRKIYGHFIRNPQEATATRLLQERQNSRVQVYFVPGSAKTGIKRKKCSIDDMVLGIEDGSEGSGVGASKA